MATASPPVPVSITVPVRVYRACAGATADDPNARVLVTCTNEDAADRVARLFEELRRGDQVVPDDPAAPETYFTAVADTDVEVASVDAALAQRLTLRAVLLATVDVPADKVLATVVDGAVEPLPAAAAATDPAASAGRVTP